MVDVSSQNNSVSINVSSSGNSASIKATPDTALFYSEKSREWAISNRIVDGVDYSSKYYNTHYLSSYSLLTNDFKYVYVLLSDFRGKKEYSIYTNTNTDVRANRKLSSQKQIINYLNKLL